MRALVRQQCRVCGLTTSSKAEMDEHIETHGQNWDPAVLRRSEDQMEFKPCLAQTRWGSDLQ